MKYNTTLPDDSVNFSSEHPLALAFKLTISLLLFAALAYFLLGFIINYAVDTITPTQEKKLESMLSIDMNLTQKDNPYLSTIADKLSECAHLPYDIKIHIIDENQANAFAAPGGNIYVTQGMIKQVKNENELAFIIGHEFGHFKNKDHLRTMGYKLVLSMFGMLIGNDFGMAANNILHLGDAKYSQKAELEADEFGLDVMNCAYGSVTDATKIFERMDDGDEWKYFMATHPGFSTRVSKMKEKILNDGMDTHKKAIPLGNIAL